MPLAYHVFSKNKNHVYVCELQRHSQHCKDIILFLKKKFITEESWIFQYFLKNFKNLLSVWQNTVNLLHRFLNNLKEGCKFGWVWKIWEEFWEEIPQSNILYKIWFSIKKKQTSKQEKKFRNFSWGNCPTSCFMLQWKGKSCEKNSHRKG